MTVGIGAVSQLKKRAPKTWVAMQTSARVGESPWQNFLFLREMRLDGQQGLHHPVLAPLRARGLVDVELFLEVVAHARDEQGVAVAGDDLRQTAHAGAAFRVFRQKRRLRVRCFSLNSCRNCCAISGIASRRSRNGGI